ncbi:spermidine synthase [Microbacterium paludicola]|uniref:spermidine synthase n=1 Tax=Microbacterium paludicola TaxID=300019 RepID=UPI0011A50753|nr:fused MFS/spermidine synthase [Microbacterium paludicola]
MPKDEPHAVVLSDGRTAHVVPHADGWMLEVGGVRQSHIAAPGQPLALAYARWMMAALGRRQRSRVAQLGGGLLMLAREIAWRWPGAEQVVVESEPALVALVRTRFPAPDGVRVIEGDARAWLARAEPRSHEAILVDVFHDGRIPPAFSSIELASDARRVLTDDGVLVVNSVAGPELTFTRRQLAGLRSVFPHVAMIVQGSALGGLRFGNACLIASGAEIEADAIREQLRGDASKGALVTDLDALIGDAAPIHEADGVWSPEPDLPDVTSSIAMIEDMRRTLTDLLPRRTPASGQRPGRRHDEG